MPGSEEGFQARMAVIGCLDVEFAANTRTVRLIKRLMADAENRGTGPVTGASIGDQQCVFIECGRQDSADGFGGDRGQYRRDRRTRAIHRDQNRHLLLGMTTLLCFSTALARLAIRQIGHDLPCFRLSPAPITLATGQHEGFISLDNAAQFSGRGLDRR